MVLAYRAVANGRLNLARGGTAALIALGSILAVSGCADVDGDGSVMNAELRGGVIVLSIDSAEPLFYERQCGGQSHHVAFEKRQGSAWTELVDERPRSWPSTGYHVDGRFVAADLGEGCAMPCEVLPDELFVGIPNEYVAADPTMPDELTSKPFRGELRVRLSYASDSECVSTRSATAVLVIE